MNPGLASTILKLSRPTARGGFTFAEKSAYAAEGVVFRARRMVNRSRENFEADRLNDKQAGEFRIRAAEWLANYQDGDELAEEITPAIVTQWRVISWHHVAGTRGLWVAVIVEETDAPPVEGDLVNALTYGGETLTYGGQTLTYS